MTLRVLPHPERVAVVTQADESAVWKITRQVSHSLKQYLTKGSIIRLIHTEKEAHLTAMHGDIDARAEPGGSHDVVFLRDYDGGASMHTWRGCEPWMLGARGFPESGL